MLTFYEKLLKNWECGLFTLIKYCGKGSYSKGYRVLSTRTSTGNFRSSGFKETEQGAISDIGSTFFEKGEIEEHSKKHNWIIIRTIHLSELMGKGYDVGDKVRIRKTGEIETITGTNYSEGYPYETDDESYSLNQIEPYFEEEEMVTIQISKKSLEGIKNYKIIK